MKRPKKSTEPEHLIEVSENIRAADYCQVVLWAGQRAGRWTYLAMLTPAVYVIEENGQRRQITQAELLALGPQLLPNATAPAA